MKEYSVMLNGSEDVKAFENIVRNLDFEMDLRRGSRYVVDAKSVLGIFSLDLSKPLTLIVHESEENKFDSSLISQFLVNT